MAILHTAMVVLYRMPKKDEGQLIQSFSDELVSFRGILVILHWDGGMGRSTIMKMTPSGFHLQYRVCDMTPV